MQCKYNNEYIHEFMSIIFSLWCRNCLDCSYEESCPYSAKKVYIDKHVEKGWVDWPINVVQPKDPIGNSI
jgi:hypothetical protein